MFNDLKYRSVGNICEKMILHINSIQLKSQEKFKSKKYFKISTYIVLEIENIVKMLDKLELFRQKNPKTLHNRGVYFFSIGKYCAIGRGFRRLGGKEHIVFRKSIHYTMLFWTF